MRIKTLNVTKSFGEVVALDHVTLEINHGEFFTLLGPSGCGKTTFLRCLAGFELIDEGSIFFDGKEVTMVPPFKRGTGMVFQNYALWPHMSVFDNVAYGLKLKKLPREEVRRRVEGVLELVKLKGLEKRTPHQLSGGQQQRVALARALVINPKVLLFDEPLSNLDAKLRIEMRVEIKKLQKKLGITTVYVTHDQEEAMSISDKIAIMNRGRIEQIGLPRDVYFSPRNFFVADFIGQGTFLKGRVVEENKYLIVELVETGETVQTTPSDPTNPPKVGDQVVVAIRPENFELNNPVNANIFEAVIYDVHFLGKTQRVMAKHKDTVFLFETDPLINLRTGGKVTLYVKPEKTLSIKI